MTTSRATAEGPHEGDALIECRIRLIGYRTPADPLAWVVSAEELALAEIAADAWLANADDADSTDLVDAPTATRMRCGARAWRSATLDARTGRLTLCSGSGQLANGDWHSDVADARNVLTDAPFAAYGFIKRGRSPEAAWNGRSLADDWPPRLDLPSSADGAPIFDSVRTPDAFGIQLLGAGYLHYPRSDHWTGDQRPPSVSTLIEHRHPDEWFSNAAPSAELLAEARDDFGWLLVEPELLDLARRS
jgi:hypothetical protein